MNSSERVSVVIPTRNAAPWLPSLLESLQAQRPAPPREIILVDSGSDDATATLAAQHPAVRLIPITHFTHGGARNLGVRDADGDWVILLTQDALPADSGWLDALLAPMRAGDADAVYARQVPRADAPPMERWFLASRFPAGSMLQIRRHAGDAPPADPLTFFSNVCSAARRETWLRFPFDETLIMSEDQQFARDLLAAGGALAYQPTAMVIHSHAYSPRQIFRRYFDSVVAFRQLTPEHGWRASTGKGKRDTLRALAFLARHHPRAIPTLWLHTACKAGGTMAALLSDHLPRGFCARCSLQPAYWRRRRT